jgi:hypothetical protein
MGLRSKSVILPKLTEGVSESSKARTISKTASNGLRAWRRLNAFSEFDQHRESLRIAL